MQKSQLTSKHQKIKGMLPLLDTFDSHRPSLSNAEFNLHCGTTVRIGIVLFITGFFPGFAPVPFFYFLPETLSWVYLPN